MDALGNPTSFALTPGQAHDLEGADLLLPEIQADTVIADKAYDADERVLRALEQAGKAAELELVAGLVPRLEEEFDHLKIAIEQLNWT